MATIPTDRIITHGNDVIKSSQFMKRLKNNHGTFEFFPFSDLDAGNKIPLFLPNPEMLSLIEHSAQGVEVSAILVLIGYKEIFSAGMHGMITSLPYNALYGFNEKNEKEWWESVIVVFSFDKNDEDMEIKVRESIKHNGGIKDICEKAGQKYITISKHTNPEDIHSMLRNTMLLMKEKKLVLKGHYQSPIFNRCAEILTVFQETLRSTNKAKRGSLDQRFVIFSENMDDKRGIEEHLFSTRKPFLGFGNKPSISGEAEMELKIYGDKGNMKMKIQALYEPGNSNSRQYGQFLADCLREQDKTTFLFIIDLSSKLHHQEKELVKIQNIAQILSTFRYNLFPNAILIFMHDEKLTVSSKGPPEQILRPILEKNPDAFDGKLIELVRQRKIYIKRLDTKETYKNEKITELFKIIFSKQTQDISKVNNISVQKISDGQYSSTTEHQKFIDLVNILKTSTDMKYQLFSPSKEKLIKKHHMKKLDEIWKSSKGEMERDSEYSFILIKKFHSDVKSNNPGAENGVYVTNLDYFGHSGADEGTATSNTNGKTSQLGADKGTVTSNTDNKTSQLGADKGTDTSNTDGKTSQLGGDEDTATSNTNGKTSQLGADKGTDTSNTDGKTSQLGGDKGTDTSNTDGKTSQLGADKGTDTSNTDDKTSQFMNRKWDSCYF